MQAISFSQHGSTDVLQIVNVNIPTPDAAINHYIETRDELLACAQVVFDMLEARTLKPHIAAWLPLAEAARAHQMMESRQVIGKLLLLPN